VRAVTNNPKPEEDDETGLVLLAQRGDRKAFEKSLRRLHSALRRYIARMAGDAGGRQHLTRDILGSFRPALATLEIRLAQLEKKETDAV
jgi:hypothetical protein